MSDKSWEEIFTRLFSEIIEISEKHFDEEVLNDFYLDLIDIIQEYDEDVFTNLMGLSIAFDEAYLKVHPNAFDDFVEDMEE